MISRTIILFSLATVCWSQDAAFLGYGEEPKEQPLYHRPNQPLNYIPNGQFGLVVQFPEKRVLGREFGGTLEERDMSLELKERERISRQTVKEKNDTVIETSGPVSEKPSRGYRPPPPPVRREVNAPPKCDFDPEKWSYHSESSMINAIMFDRETGISCEECMKKCTSKQSGQWTCRSVVYDSKWNICDLFAITATYSPYFLVDYPGRNYFEYLTARSASVSELGEMKQFVKEKEESNLITCESIMEEKKKLEKASGVKTSQSKVEEIENKSEGSLYGAVPIKEQLKAEEINEKQEEKKEIQKIQKEKKVEKDKVDIVTEDKEKLEKSAVNMATEEVSVKTEMEMVELGEKIEKESMENKDSEEKIIEEKVIEEPKTTTEVIVTSTDTSTSTTTTEAPTTATATTTVSTTTEATTTTATITSPAVLDETKLTRTEVPEHKITVTTEQTITTRAAPKKLKFFVGKTEESDSSSEEEEIVLETTTIRVAAKMHGVKKTKFASRTSVDEVEEAYRDILIRPYPQANNKRKLRMVSAKVKELNTKHEELLVKEITRETSCAENQAAGLMVYESSTRLPFSSADVKRFPSKTLEQCVEKCKHDNDCSSAIFSPSGCEISSTKARPGMGDISPSNTCYYIEKICISQKAANERVLSFPARPNHILAGFVEEVEDAESIDKCVEMCMQSRERHGFHCLSAMYYGKQRIQNCVLNTESKETKPSRYLLQENGPSANALYFQLSDAVQLRKEKGEADIIRKDSVTERQFTIWSSCEGKTENEMRYRYRKCKDHKDIRQCPKESAFCGSNQKRGPRVSKLTPEMEEQFRARAKV